jgi:hypothetical protein
MDGAAVFLGGFASAKPPFSFPPSDNPHAWPGFPLGPKVQLSLRTFLPNA